MLPLLVGAFLGAVISILTRLNHFSSAEVFDPFLIFLTATIKPFIAIIIATLIFAVLRTEVIYIAGINFNQVDKIPYVLWVIGFLAGFGERLIRDVVARNADIYDVETPGATKR